MIMRCRRSLILAAVAAAGLALLAAGCGGGGSGSPGIATVASSTTRGATTIQNGPVAFARCMRAHGVPDFPDPDSAGEIPKRQVVAANKNDPRFDAADNACIGLLPNRSLAPQESAQQRRTRLADELSFARCMRSHGLGRFPDPSAQGELTVAMVQAQGIDVHSPAVLHVVQTCLPASHGALTAAKVREAIDNAGR
jgi:hypothetical protein